MAALSTTEMCCLEANIRAPGYCDVCHQASQPVMEMMCIFIWYYFHLATHSCFNSVGHTTLQTNISTNKHKQTVFADKLIPSVYLCVPWISWLGQDQQHLPNILLSWNTNQFLEYLHPSNSSHSPESLQTQPAQESSQHALPLRRKPKSGLIPVFETLSIKTLICQVFKQKKNVLRNLWLWYLLLLLQNETGSLEKTPLALKRQKKSYFLHSVVWNASCISLYEREQGLYRHLTAQIVFPESKSQK